jgi:hypothetical protein
MKFIEQSLISSKEGQVISAKRFVANLSRKVNTTKPSLSVTNALVKAYTLLGITASVPFTIIETIEQNKF